MISRTLARMYRALISAVVIAFLLAVSYGLTSVRRYGTALSRRSRCGGLGLQGAQVCQGLVVRDHAAVADLLTRPRTPYGGKAGECSAYSTPQIFASNSIRFNVPAFDR